MGYIRARRPEQVAERRQEILAAAAGLFAERGYIEVNFNEIARRAGFTRSNIYRYFATREEICLALYLEELQAWDAAVSRSLGQLPANAGSAIVSRAMADSISGHGVLLELMQLQPALLATCTADSVAAFQTEQAGGLNGLRSQLNRLLGDLSDNDISLVILSIHALMAGLWPPTASREHAAQQMLVRPISALLTGLRRDQQNRISLTITRGI